MPRKPTLRAVPTKHTIPPETIAEKVESAERKLTRESYEKKLTAWAAELERHRTIAREAQTNIDRCEGGILAVRLLLDELNAAKKAASTP
jgi:hypothetical protein